MHLPEPDRAASDRRRHRCVGGADGAAASSTRLRWPGRGRDTKAATIRVSARRLR